MASDVFMQHGIKFMTRPTKVLLVDEDAGDLRGIRLTLEGQGYEVFTCPTYEAGVKCLESESFDFVVVSQGTLAFEGRSVLDRAIQLDRHRAVLVLTRCIDMHCYLEAMQMGAIDYIAKPVPPADLLRFVRTHIRRPPPGPEKHHNLMRRRASTRQAPPAG
jgi:DNA-binding response OmpR family regulator